MHFKNFTEVFIKRILQDYKRLKKISMYDQRISEDFDKFSRILKDFQEL